VLLGQQAADERLAFLPMCHVTERVLGLYAALCSGTVTNLVESAETVPENLQEVRPTVLSAIPRVWEKFHSRISVAVADATWLQRRLFGWAMNVGRRRAEARLAGRRGEGLSWRLAQLPLHRVRAAVGLDRLRWASVAAAPIAPELVHWFMALGIDILESYGQTECTGLACAMPKDAVRPGTAGKPVPWGELSVAPDGEILLRGPHVAQGYWRQPDAWAERMRGGWLHTGDLGRLEDGYLRITGRRTDQLVTTGGALVAPAEIEAALKASPFIADALVVGDGRAHLACLVMLDADTVEKWAQDNNVAHTSYASLTAAEPVRALVGRELARVNAQGGARIDEFRIIARRLAPEDRELTPTMKLRRFVVLAEYGELIEDMYRAA
ncbi:MAG TPA: AMP-binding protein, partial [Acetobacteraceae bacterium]